VFTCVHAGFCPWIAGSTGTVSASRLDRIVEGLVSCHYSIHDLSRYRGEGTENLSRFNMPLELGMAMGLRAGEPGESTHDWMVMGPDGHLFHRYISDLSGHDPLTHDGSVKRVVTTVLSWLLTRPDSPHSVKPVEVMGKLEVYARRKRELDEEFRGTTPPWGEICGLALEVAKAELDGD
jgi:hypothetical protein